MWLCQKLSKSNSITSQLGKLLDKTEKTAKELCVTLQHDLVIFKGLSHVLVVLQKFFLAAMRATENILHEKNLIWEVTALTLIMLGEEFLNITQVTCPSWVGPPIMGNLHKI